MRAFLHVLVPLLLLPLPAASGAPDGIEERIYDAKGRLVAELGSEPGRAGLAFLRSYHYPASATDAALEGNDCPSTAYKLTRWRWSEPYAVQTTAFTAEVAAGLAAWDAETSRALVGAVTEGSGGSAGTYDGVNQLDWVDLGGTSTIAVTTTWYYRTSGRAVESDGRYNTRFAWATDGRGDAMDVQNIVAHEVGHTFGLDHPKGKDIGCLTMYAYGSEGETRKRTLGVGDILGIRAIYGA